MEPDRIMVENRLSELVEGTLDPAQAAAWATHVMQDLEDEDVDDTTWAGLDRLSGADLLAAPGQPLHSQEDYRAWLIEFRAGHADGTS
jgi:hypothetical protein